MPNARRKIHGSAVEALKLSASCAHPVAYCHYFIVADAPHIKPYTAPLCVCGYT